MPIESVLVYSFTSGDNTYPHSGTFTIGNAGSIEIDDSNGSSDAYFGDYTHTGGADVPDQDVTSSTVAGINVGDTVDLRYKYTITGSDGSSGTIHFLATNSAANYGPLFVSDFKLDPSVTYTFGAFNTDGAALYTTLVTCFTSGTFIATAHGNVPIETLKEGDQVHTRDNGFQPLRWIGKRTVHAIGKTAPIHFAKGVLGNNDDLLVSQNHRMLYVAPMVDLYFSDNEVLIPAKHLLSMDGVTVRSGGMVTYIHILFDEHQVVVANGSPSESFFPGDVALNSLEAAAQQEVLELFPQLGQKLGAAASQTARICLKRQEAAILQRYAA